MKALLFIATRQLWDRKLLNGIAVLGVVLGVLTLVGITGIMHGFQNRFLDTILKISPHVVVLDQKLGRPESIVSRLLGTPIVAAVSHQTNTDRQLRIVRPEETLGAIRGLSGVEAASGVVVGNAVVSVGVKAMPVEVRGVDPAVQDRVTPLRVNLVAGDMRALSGSVDSAMIGQALGDLLGVKIGDSIDCIAARGDRTTLRVVAFFETRITMIDKARVYTSQRVAQSLLGRGDAIDRIEIKLLDPEGAPEVAERLERIFGYDAESWQETNASILGVFAQQNTITGMMIGAVLAVGGFGILAIQIMIVLEKRKDIALLKAVGYSARDVLAIFLFEGSTIAVLGALIGSIAGHYLLEALRHVRAAGMAYVRPENFAIHETFSMYVSAVAFAVLVGVLASLVPAWRASRVEPVDVLRGT